MNPHCGSESIGCSMYHPFFAIYIYISEENQEDANQISGCPILRTPRMSKAKNAWCPFSVPLNRPRRGHLQPRKEMTSISEPGDVFALRHASCAFQGDKNCLAVTRKVRGLRCTLLCFENGSFLCSRNGQPYTHRQSTKRSRLYGGGGATFCSFPWVAEERKNPYLFTGGQSSFSPLGWRVVQLFAWYQCLKAFQRPTHDQWTKQPTFLTGFSSILDPILPQVYLKSSMAAGPN